jgi:hypothetical protein
MVVTAPGRRVHRQTGELGSAREDQPRIRLNRLRLCQGPKASRGEEWVSDFYHPPDAVIFTRIILT